MLINKISLIQVDYEQSFFFSAVHNLSGSNQLKKLILAHSRKFMEGLRYHGSSVSDVHLELSQLQTKPKSLISALCSQ